MKTTETTPRADGSSTETTREDLCSAEISRNAKGEYSISIKCYAETTNEAAARAAETIKWTEGLLGIRKTEVPS